MIVAERALCANPGGTAEVKTFVPEVGTKVFFDFKNRTFEGRTKQW
ncbi:hypothetical protein HMPREF3293_02900 [Christensenella minuta]|uniref:Uncharacterized protein n=1 Tax=Christensenella minuta TaxID=626937 RepID=A0A136Q196_9FIRM|nr:hypothetical protein HMPREF3293_02900 [Christensenella minuta]